ncbi:MAG: Abnormal spindle-like microcephaly-assocd, ASPM-SPD-2-Hydin [Chloroflexota bacterium]|nr:Abnormal spindle-like microcephaly-assocd, ASPM-SPD-2-Hydin [Chloroflexota bacterium]
MEPSWEAGPVNLWPFRPPDAEPVMLQPEATGVAAGTGSLAPRVVSARRRQGRTQTELALAIGWSERNLRRLEKGELPWVRAIENGTHHPTARERTQLRALARELRTDLDDLLPSADVVPAPPRLRVAGEASPAGVRRPMLARTRRPRHAGTASAAVVGTAAVLGAGHLLTGAPPPSSDRFATPLTARTIAPAATPPGRATAAPAAPASPSAAAQSPDPAAGSGTAAGAAGAAVADPQLVAVDVSHPPVGPIASLSASTVDFGWVAVGSTAPRTVTLTNVGNGPLHVSRTTLLGSSEVSATDDSCAGRTLAPHQQCSVTLVYAPHQSGMLAPFAQLGFADDAPGVGGGQAVPLAGATGA